MNATPPKNPSTASRRSIERVRGEGCEGRGSKKTNEKLEAVGRIGEATSAEVQKVIIGKSHVIDNVLINILSNGNLLFEDYPGLAKIS